jgi:hypothetical protein
MRRSKAMRNKTMRKIVTTFAALGCALVVGSAALAEGPVEAVVEDAAAVTGAAVDTAVGTAGAANGVAAHTAVIGTEVGVGTAAVGTEAAADTAGAGAAAAGATRAQVWEPRLAPPKPYATPSALGRASSQTT